MASRSLPNVGLKGFWVLGKDGWKAENDLNLLMISVLLQGSAIDIVSSEPGSVVGAEVYILDETNPTNPNKIIVYDNAAWVYIEPERGWTMWVEGGSDFYWYDGSVWAAMPSGGGDSGVDPLVLLDATDNYTPSLTDSPRQYITLTAATGKVVTIPANATEAFPVGSEIYVEAGGVGVVGFAAAGGVSLNSRDSVPNIAGQYGVAMAIKKDTNIWTLLGDLSA